MSNTFFFFKLASAVLEAVENNTLSIEPVGLQPIRFVKASAVECGGPKYVFKTLSYRRYWVLKFVLVEIFSFSSFKCG